MIDLLHFIISYITSEPTISSHCVGYSMGMFTQNGGFAMTTPEEFVCFPGLYAIAFALWGVATWHIAVSKMIFGDLPGWAYFFIDFISGHFGE